MSFASFPKVTLEFDYPPFEHHIPEPLYIVVCGEEINNTYGVSGECRFTKTQIYFRPIKVELRDQNNNILDSQKIFDSKDVQKLSISLNNEAPKNTDDASLPYSIFTRCIYPKSHPIR